MIDLSGDWTLTEASGEYTCPMTFPGDGITALHAAGLIPDPYWGRNEESLRWIADRDWTARRQVVLDRTDVELVACGLDTVCTIRVNGQTVLESRNAFREYRRDLSSFVRVGVNDLEIVFHSATQAANAAQAAQPFPIPYIANNNPIPNGNMLRKPACDWGWDWNIALCPFGVTGGIEIVDSGSLFQSVRISQHHDAGHVLLRVAIDTAPGWDGALCQVRFAGMIADREVFKGRIDVELDVSHLPLWWPAGMGDQTLHELWVRCEGDSICRKIGLRQIELVTEKDTAGLSFKFRVNGRDVFAKGANWIPADALAGRITPEKTRALLQSAVDANMNMVRVWGGGRYEPDSFYDACDELGLMVWQDMMFSCNLYPSTPDFLAEVAAEVRENVARISHHACVALWCGDNELIGALTWFPESRADRDRYLVNYDRLNRTIETALKATDPAASWWPSSPSPGPLNFRDAWHEDGSGDMHFWSVWHEGRDFDHYRDVSPRFCSEFGFQSYPSMDVIETFTGPGDRNIASPVFEGHQKNKGGNARIAETMFRYFRWPEKFADFVWLSQIQHGLAMKTAVTHWRSLKPHCMGALIWQLNDTWPVCSWSMLDYGGGWKMPQYMARRFFQPVLVTAVPVADGIALRAVNDTAAALDLTVSAVAVDMSGATRPVASATVTVPPDAAVTALTIEAGALAPDEMLAYVWQDAQGNRISGDIHAPRPWKSYDLRPAHLTHTATRSGDTWQITLTAQALSLFATVQADVPGHFSDAAMMLFPGHPATITFTPTNPGAVPQFTLRDLHSATCA